MIWPLKAIERSIRVFHKWLPIKQWKLAVVVVVVASNADSPAVRDADTGCGRMLAGSQ